MAYTRTYQGQIMVQGRTYQGQIASIINCGNIVDCVNTKGVKKLAVSHIE